MVFQALEHLQPHCSHQPLQPHWPHKPLQPYFIKEPLYSEGFDDSWHQNDQYWSIFVERIIKNPFSLLILAPFMSKAIKDSQCYFFEN